MRREKRQKRQREQKKEKGKDNKRNALGLFPDEHAAFSNAIASDEEDDDAEPHARLPRLSRRLRVVGKGAALHDPPEGDVVTGFRPDVEHSQTGFPQSGELLGRLLEHVFRGRVAGDPAQARTARWPRAAGPGSRARRRTP